MIEALYVHIPFCASRCSYCAFPTRKTHDAELMDAYVEALVLALRRAARAGLLSDVRTIYIGGGTPSHLGARRLNSLVYALSLSVCLERVEEFSLEANPESLTAGMVRDLYALGVSRFSLGVQSFDDAELAAYGRIHDAAQARAAIEFVRQRTDNISIDLMCGGPRQTRRSWERSVQQAIELDVPHVSVYPLALEPGTPLAAAYGRGEVVLADDDAQADMMLAACELLGAAGLARYETASYARAGFESRHNSAYWTGVGYLGLGAGAASMLDVASYRRCMQAGMFEDADVDAEGLGGEISRVRLTAPDDARAFCEARGAMRVQTEFLDTRQSALEDVMLGMRMSRGVSEELYSGACELADGLDAVMASLEAAGLVRRRDGRIAPTQRGWLCGNDVFGAIWGLA